MDQLDDDVIQAGLDAQQEAYQLVRHAISASTTHEKNKIIEQLKIIWKTHESAADQLNTCNSNMAQTLAHLESKAEAQNLKYQTLCNNTSFLNQLERYPPTEQDRDARIAAIREIEESTKRIGPISTPTLLSQVESLDRSQDFGHLKLRDLTFKRLEELTCSLKKRSFIVDESEDLSLTVASEFGSLNGLIETHNRLQEENIQLKSEESVFIDDTIVKRRNLNAISTSLLSDLIVSMQEELKMQNKVGESITLKPFEKDEYPPFDDYCQTHGEIEFNKHEFSTTISVETINALMNAETPEAKLEAMTAILREQENTIERLLHELEPLRYKRYSSDDDSQQRIERLWALHDKFQGQIQAIQDQITFKNDESRNIYRDIMIAVKQREHLGTCFGEWIHKYKSLIADDSYLLKLSEKNSTIVQNLASLTFDFGLLLMDMNSDNTNLHTQYLKKMVEPYKNNNVIMPHEPEHAPGTASPHEELDTSEKPKKTARTNRKRAIALSLMKLKRQQNASNENLQSSGDSPAQSRSSSPLFKYPPNIVSQSSNVQLFDYLALAYDISTMMKNPQDRTSFHPYISGQLHYTLGSLRTELYQELSQFEEQMKGQISRVTESSNFILRRPKADIETEANTQPRIDNEGQTEEEEKGKKGAKGKASAKSSARAKAATKKKGR